MFRLSITQALSFIWDKGMYVGRSLYRHTLCPPVTWPAELCFSGMKRLKIPLRSTMSAILHIHRRKDADIDNVVAEIARLNPLTPVPPA